MPKSIQRRRGCLPKGRPKEVLKRAHMSTWEKDEPRIDEIYEDVSGWKGRVTWRDLEVVTYPVKTLYMRCPQKVLFYYEQELRRLRAEQTSAGQTSQQWVRESALEISTPQTPAIASLPTKQWSAPEALMYDHNHVRQLQATISGYEQSVGDRICTTYIVIPCITFKWLRLVGFATRSSSVASAYEKHHLTSYKQHCGS
ncbi:hypothetical protein T440DRAFT_536462 [Plenodomus tracheiphilus IPT5]|uniref:Chromo shadow domain-containing protein n=1 Tax=Plenodomus tracheiphilus IPT5 TaxID=1408161 RepID=A0A6A7AZ36_9PLEO|nr:hypothetical protein T440DRAFT_536462 [Plenodomus tracheiphilus IPT5]